MAHRLRSLPSAPLVLDNQNGVVLYAVLMVLLLLTIIGVASTKVSNTEIQISGNEQVYLQNLYRAEGATMEAAELLEAIADPVASSPAWLANAPHSVTDSQIRAWQFGASPTPLASVLADTSLVVLSEGIVRGSSLDLESSKVHSYAVYGRSAPPRRGATTVQIGYLKAF